MASSQFSLSSRLLKKFDYGWSLVMVMVRVRASVWIRVRFSVMISARLD